MAIQTDVDIQPEEELYKILCSEAGIEIPTMSLVTLKGLALRMYFKRINKNNFINSNKSVYHQYLACIFV